MASFGSLKSTIFEKEERKQQYQDQIRGLNAFDRHKKFLKDYVDFYGRGRNVDNVLPSKTDQDTLREGYRFIRSEEDDMDQSWEQRLVKRYYDKLFKEYCIADMSHYKKGKIGLRWRTEKEVMSGKGQFICGNKQCSEKDSLASYEVNFSYIEAGENKQALVKLVACERCAEKLVYKKRKEKEEIEKREESRKKKRGGDETDNNTDDESDRSKKRKEKEHINEREPSYKKKRVRTESDSDTDDEHDRSNRRKRKGKKASTSTDNEKVDDHENFNEFLEGMFP